MELLALVAGAAIGVPAGIWILHHMWGRTFDGKEKVETPVVRKAKRAA